MLGNRQTRAEPIALLGAAYRVATDLGAEPFAAEIERLASRARLEPPGAERPADPSSGQVGAVLGDPFGLTQREIEVLRLVAGGRSNRSIAEALFISPKTASVHVSNILSKLAVTSRVEAAAVDSAWDWVSRPENGAGAGPPTTGGPALRDGRSEVPEGQALVRPAQALRSVGGGLHVDAPVEAVELARCGQLTGRRGRRSCRPIWRLIPR